MSFTPGVLPQYSQTLNKIDEVVQPNEVCQAILDNLAGGPGAFPFRFTDTLVCAKPAAKQVGDSQFLGLCQGDSGGALVVKRGILQHDVIVGIVTDTWSIQVPTTGEILACGNGIDIFTRLTNDYIGWIIHTITLNSFL